jgi:hypothetical protein
MTESNIDFQLTPPHVHRRNAAERAIRTFKNHFISGFSSINTNFPLNLWEKLLPQGLLIINLLRRSRINHPFSAQSQAQAPVHGAGCRVQGAFDFNTPSPWHRLIPR